MDEGTQKKSCTIYELLFENQHATIGKRKTKGTRINLHKFVRKAQAQKKCNNQNTKIYIIQRIKRKKECEHPWCTLNPKEKQ
jgi:hypothetical protein